MNESSTAPSATTDVLLIDGHSLLHRAFYALPALSTSDGVPTNAVYGLALMLNRLIQDERPKILAVAFDVGKPTFRHHAYEDYKKTRPSMPEELRTQVPLAKELVKAFGIPIFEIEGYEADDVIGTLSQEAETNGLKVLIVTGDMDALQLVSQHVTALITRRGIKETLRFNPEKVRQHLGVPPERVADLKGLMGDASDNIPGVPGIGQKTATRLLGEFGSMDALLSRADEVTGRAGKALRDHLEQARMSRDLALIDRNVPLEVDWDTLQWPGPNAQALSALYRRLEFRRLLEELQTTSPTSSASPKDPQGHTPTIEVLVDPADIEAAWKKALTQTTVAVLPLYEGQLPFDAELIGFAWATPGQGVYVPLAHQEGPNAPQATFLSFIKDTLCDGGNGTSKATEIHWISHDVKALHNVLALVDIPLAISVHDVMLQGYLNAPGTGEHTLDELAARCELDIPAPDKEVLSLRPPQDVGPWFAARCHALIALETNLCHRLKREELFGVYHDLELPLVRVLSRMERRGIRVDLEYLRALSQEFTERIDRLEESIYELAGETFNLNSPKQLSRVLFEALGLPILKRTRTGPSTSADVLEELAHEHKIAGLILDYRHLQKLQSTYVDALPGMVHAATGRLHTTFNQHVTATGRLSSNRPNLQNIPIRTPEGRRIRRAFIPSDGMSLVKADYSQIELRILAHVADDPVLIDAFRRGEDIHRKTASEIFEVPAEAVSSDQREAAKAINFGIVYGISSFGLARGTGLTREEAQAFIDAYLNRYTGVARYMKDVVALAKQEGYVTTLWGRRRYIPDIKSKRWATRSMAERTAINTPIQGSAADLIKQAMIAVDTRLARSFPEAHILLQVHDELLLEVPTGNERAVGRIVKEEMEHVAELAVPVIADVSSGPNWLEQEPLDV